MKAALLSLLLAGCAIPFPESMYDWKQTHDPLPYSWHQIPQAAVDAYCHTATTHVMACAYWDHEQCWIFTAYDKLPETLRRHEERHCEGWNHQII